MERFSGSSLANSLGLKLVAFGILLLASLATFNVASANAADGTIIATKGADRSASSAVSGATTYADPVAGATFEYTSDDPTLPAASWTAFPGVTLANGQASVMVAPGIYYVREQSGGTGTSNYGPVQSLTWSGGVQPYVARVSVESGETTYATPHFNADPDPAEWDPTNAGSLSNNGSPFINVRDNQDVTPGCGKNLLLVLDRSGSIEPFKDEYRDCYEAVRRTPRRHPGPDRDHQLQRQHQFLRSGDRKPELLPRPARPEHPRQRCPARRDDRQHLREPELPHQLGRSPECRFEGQDVHAERRNRPDRQP